MSSSDHHYCHYYNVVQIVGNGIGDGRELLNVEAEVIYRSADLKNNGWKRWGMVLCSCYALYAICYDFSTRSVSQWE